MGLGLFSRSYKDKEYVYVDNNPKPDNYEIVDYFEGYNHLAMFVKYPDATNYEGNKVLVYEGVSLLNILHQRTIDPHFLDDETYFSPIARFVPTPEGWVMAKAFCRRDYEDDD